MNLAFAQRIPDGLFEIGIAQLAARNVHADEQGRREREETLPMGELACRARQREASQRNDKAGLLGMGDEIAGRNNSPLGMMPAQQRFEARKRAIGEADDRLIEEIELVFVERAAKLRLEGNGIAARERLEIL